mgnify:CR=1 FL=1
MDTKKKGYFAESYACGLLTIKGYKILDRNFRCKLGEIDIIALKENTLVFIEVKARANKKYGLPQEAVTPTKIKKIQKVSDFYRLNHDNLPKKSRIDVVAIIYEGISVKSFEIIPVV